MPRKKKSNGNQGKATTLVFPTHAEIEETLMRRIGFWEHPDRKGPYPLPVLDFLINAIGCEIETGEGGEEFAKDAEFYNPHWGIENGVASKHLTFHQCVMDFSTQVIAVVEKPKKGQNGANGISILTFAARR